MGYACEGKLILVWKAYDDFVQNDNHMLYWWMDEIERQKNDGKKMGYKMSGYLVAWAKAGKQKGRKEGRKRSINYEPSWLVPLVLC